MGSLVMAVVALTIAVVALTTALGDAPTGRVRHVHPGESLAEAIDAAEAGESVVVHAGAYPLLTVWDRSATGEVEVRAARRERVLVAGADIRRSSRLRFRGIHWTDGVYLRDARDVRFDGGSSHVDPSVINFDVRDGCRQTRIENMRVTGGLSHFNINAVANATQSRATYIRDNAMGRVRQDHVIVNRGAKVYVQRNRIHGLVDSPEHSDGVQAVGVDGLYIERNEMWTPRASRDAARDTNDHGILLNHDLSTGRVTRNVHISNNLIHDWFGYGIGVVGGENVRIFNNSVFDNGPEGTARAMNLDPRPRHEVSVAWWNNAFDSVYVAASELRIARNEANFVADGSGPAGSRRLVGRPRFSDRAAADYRPAPGSRLIGTGSLRGAATVDLLGRARGRKPSRGALEPARR